MIYPIACCVFDEEGFLSTLLFVPKFGLMSDDLGYLNQDPRCDVIHLEH